MPEADYTVINQLFVNGVTLILAVLSLALTAKLLGPFVQRAAAAARPRRVENAPMPY